ncbi:MAG TPA: helix-turn-helix transcriptional regulator [Lentimicrobium sp.]|nr:helix-turn-helix transcriptional regulator [Lentimicrobium sp.]
MKHPFEIFKLTPLQASKIASMPVDPHVHEFEELLVGVEGSLEHLIDFKSDVYKAPYLSFIAKGKVHRLRPLATDGKCSVWVIKFDTDFIPDTSFGLYSLYHNNSNIETGDNPYFRRIALLCEMMHEEMQQDAPSLNIIRDLLKTTFSMAGVLRDRHNEDPAVDTQNTAFTNFLAILEENYKRPEAGVEFYAEKLFMSSRNLNLITQSIMNKSVSEIIETRRLTESKNLLASTDKPISEIGYELGYNEKSYFTTVFKKKTGMTPSMFRENIKNLI